MFQDTSSWSRCKCAVCGERCSVCIWTCSNSLNAGLKMLHLTCSGIDMLDERLFFQTAANECSKRRTAPAMRQDSMSALFDFQGLLVVMLLSICTCSYLRPRFGNFLQPKALGHIQSVSQDLLLRLLARFSLPQPLRLVSGFMLSTLQPADIVAAARRLVSSACLAGSQ